MVLLTSQMSTFWFFQCYHSVQIIIVHIYSRKYIHNLMSVALSLHDHVNVKFKKMGPDDQKILLPQFDRTHDSKPTSSTICF